MTPNAAPRPRKDSGATPARRAALEALRRPKRATRTRMGADPSAVGWTFSLDDQTFQTVGVAPEGFRGLQAQAVAEIPDRLDAFQASLLEGAKARREANSHRGVADIGQLKEIMESGGGFVYTGWSGDPEVEERVKEETTATLRCIPDEEFRSSEAPTKCIGGGEAKMEVVWDRAY